jgi:hypothetical protein
MKGRRTYALTKTSKLVRMPFKLTRTTTRMIERELVKIFATKMVKTMIRTLAPVIPKMNL